MNILSAPQIREADAFTIANEGIKSIDLMERAAAACCSIISIGYEKHWRFLVFCGTGNNGGDGLALARQLFQHGYEVIPYIIRHNETPSEDCRINEARLMQLDLSLVRNVYSIEDIAEIEGDCVIVDALFGTGLNRPLSGLAAETVAFINDSGCEVISIDMPSGLMADTSSASEKTAIVRANRTLTFQVMKLAFLFAENYTYTGDVTVADIGLDENFISETESPFRITEKEDLHTITAKRRPFSHKGTYGHALLVCGSTGKPGAAILAAKACLRSGAGLLTVHVPKSIFNLIPVAVPESMFSCDADKDCFTDNLSMDSYDALGVGCGIGTSDKTAKALRLLIQGYRYPTVFDADAINIIAANKTWLEFIAPGSIFTPHPKEFERLVGKSENNFERNRMQIEFAKKYKIYLVLKGRYTAIACPDGICYFNPTGNPGMATAGSGDVLTGIITGLLAQGFTPREASLGGVYLHGLAGDLAAAKKSQPALIASDIIDAIGQAYLVL